MLVRNNFQNHHYIKNTSNILYRGNRAANLHTGKLVLNMLQSVSKDFLNLICSVFLSPPSGSENTMLSTFPLHLQYFLLPHCSFRKAVFTD